MGIESCCYKCERRHIGCHSVCEDYKRYRKLLDAFREKRERENSADIKRYIKLGKRWVRLH